MAAFHCCPVSYTHLTPMDKPPRDMRFKEVPEKYRTTKVVTMDKGMEMAMTPVNLKFFRKRKRTKIAKKAAMKILDITL